MQDLYYVLKDILNVLRDIRTELRRKNNENIGENIQQRTSVDAEKSE